MRLVFATYRLFFYFLGKKNISLYQNVWEKILFIYVEV